MEIGEDISPSHLFLVSLRKGKNYLLFPSLAGIMCLVKSSFRRLCAAANMYSLLLHYNTK